MKHLPLIAIIPSLFALSACSLDVKSQEERTSPSLEHGTSADDEDSSERDPQSEEVSTPNVPEASSSIVEEAGAEEDSKCDFSEQAENPKRIYADRDGCGVKYSAAKEDKSLGKGDLTLLMVVDQSTSMTAAWEGSSKWEITKSSLFQAVATVEKEVTVGAIFFPQGESCAVAPMQDPLQFQFQRGDFFQSRLATLGGATGSGTPMFDAFLRADDAIHRAIADGALDGRLRLALLTDGEPNCAYDNEMLVTMADSWRDLGVEVFVMGLPGSEAARILLDRIAGKEIDVSAPVVPPSTTWEEGDDQANIGVVTPETQDDLDDSLHLVVK